MKSPRTCHSIINFRMLPIFVLLCMAPLVSAAPSGRYTQINPDAAYDNSFDGWGVSLCWWANMCGTWSDKKIDEIVDWLVSPSGLNYSVFRYNIGGGDDPLNRNCTPHHMGSGKGLRAEMEGFKDSLSAPYKWNRDAAQRKIMLKIKEKRPDAIFEAFSNSPPYYMTVSGCCAGNTNASLDNLKPQYYEAFAQYLVDVCTFYRDSFNIEFATLAPFNEPVTNYWQAGGGQEGCHFSTATQLPFLKILSPILKKSGLKTVLSAADETSTTQSVTDFVAYAADGAVLEQVGQWNTHTYTADNKSRANNRALATFYKKPLWMSEVGSGGTGIAGNLDLAQKLMDDVRYLRPEAWVDWQYIEEGNDQWCLVKGVFATETCERVKNYYVRQQFSRYIKSGSRFLFVPDDKILASLSPKSDTLVLVVLNNTGAKTEHYIDLSRFQKFGTTITATRTSASENCVAITDFKVQDVALTLSPPAYSITTLLIPVVTGEIDKKIPAEQPCLILPRTSSLVMQAVKDSISINPYTYGDSTQLWKCTPSGTGYRISNCAGKVLTDNGTYFAQAAATTSAYGQVFTFESIGDNCFKITSQSSGKSLDLEGEKNSAGTKTGFYAYGTSVAASHRQWILYALHPEGKTGAGTPLLYKSIPATGRMLSVCSGKGALLVTKRHATPLPLDIFDLRGNRVVQLTIVQPRTQITLQPGTYLVKHRSRNAIVEMCVVR